MINPVRQVLEIGPEDKVELVGRSLDGAHLVTNQHVLTNGEFHDCLCPHCRRSLMMKVRASDEASVGRPRRLPPQITEHAFGFVALMYGSAPAYFVGALVTGWSLAHHTSVPLSCRILLCTDDVPETFKTLLASVWTVRRVEYINKASPWFYWDYHKSRFKQVFTKLRVLKDLHGMFKKVVLLDLDLLVRGEVDSLFQLPAPAAMVRGQSPWKHGETVPVDAFFMAHRQVGGINCGVMLVEPSGEIFDKMLKEVQQYVHPEHWPSHGPEQDYLSRFYNAFGRWTSMSCRYNYQVHLTQFGSIEWHHYNVKGHPGVSIFHFSGRLVKPWSLLLDLRIAHNMPYEQLEEFISQIAINAEVELDRINKSLNDPLRTENAGKPDRPPPDDEADAIDSHFCYGTGPKQIKACRCYTDRYIHPSWSEADSVSCIEWIRAFKEADEALDGRVTSLLQSMWEQEKSSRSDI